MINRFDTDQYQAKAVIRPNCFDDRFEPKAANWQNSILSEN
ncbi:hypothetical protein RUESEDTHA_01496 [Ruegeria sp. THAF57]|nr:hypothetical protein RUESEDTHA_01496 [Ruegeria sp. THAF57]